MSRTEEGKLRHADDIDKYVYRGEATRTAQDPTLLDMIRSSGDARRLVRLATAEEDADKQRSLIEQSFDALREVGSATYLEFGWGSLVLRDLVYEDWRATQELRPQLLDPEGSADHRKRDLEELNRLAQSISERLRRIYRTGEARRGG